MKIRIVLYEEIGEWILGKFARKLNEEIGRAGFECSIAKTPDPGADINHHIIYINYPCVATNIDTLMVTHIDTLHKLSLLKQQLAVARLGVCMSRENQLKLIDAGIPAGRVCYVNPAHDEIMKPRPLNLGITVKVHSDGRKEENSIAELCSRISPEDFRFTIMGAGWQKVVRAVRDKGFQVDYYDDFDYEKYRTIVPGFDYFLYIAHDEGSMGFMDALSAGVKTIVTPQGYHLDAPGAITHPIKNLEELVAVCRGIAERRRKLVDSVRSWTWANYARKHIELWKFLLDGKPAAAPAGGPDGLASLLSGAEAPRGSLGDRLAFRLSLLKNSPRTFYNYFPEAGGGTLDFIRKAAKRLKKRFSR